MAANVPQRPWRLVIVTLDHHLAGAVERAQAELARRSIPIRLSLHAAADWDGHPALLDAALTDIARADCLLVTMLFIEDHIRAVLPAIMARREAADAVVCMMSAGEVTRLTRMGQYRMDAPASGAMALLKRLRGSSRPGTSSGAGQMAMLKRLPRLLKYIPGTAQDVRAYFQTLRYWLAGSDDNVLNMAVALAGRYAAGPHAATLRALSAAPPADYPEVGVYHPRMPGRLSESAARLPVPAGASGHVGLLVLRSYLLANDTAHYDAVIDALEARGLAVTPVFASGLDSRPAIERYLLDPARPRPDALVSLTGFSLVGGPAFNDSAAAEDILARLDVPLMAAHPLEFQTLEAWGASRAGLTPLEATMMVAIPELDGATAPHVYAGRTDGVGAPCCGCPRGCSHQGGLARAMLPCPERVEALADKVVRQVALRRSARAQRRIGVVLYDFPPGAGATGSAAFLSVWESLHATITRLAAEGYAVEVPDSAEALRLAVCQGNAAQFGTPANVHTRLSADDLVAREPYLAEIEAAWGPAPGRQLSDGRHVFILGARFGNLFVGVQPPMGVEGDPVRLLAEGGFAPTHAFAAFYRWLRQDFGAHALLHFGTHGALEFMPGKQTGLSGRCWPERLLGGVPNIYLYAANNPSEGMLAKRRSGATLVSHLTPPLASAGLYRGLADLKAAIGRARAAGPAERAEACALVAELAQGLDIDASGLADDPDGAALAALQARLYDWEQALIPEGLHVIGRVSDASERATLLASVAEARGEDMAPGWLETLVAGPPQPAAPPASGRGADGPPPPMPLARIDALLRQETELPAIIAALDGRYIHPAPGGDLVRAPEILPTGRNLHGLDPFRIPSAFALKDGARMAERLIARHAADHGAPPRSVAMVLWGTDNLKSEGAQLAQALWLMGARPRHDSYGRLAGAELVPLAELGRARIDVVITLSGIFRDLLPMQARLLAEAAWLAAQADEPDELNAIRAHARAQAASLGVPLATAALRVFGNAPGAYGANVNQLIESGQWDDPEELARAFERRKGFAYGASGAPRREAAVMEAALATAECAVQNLESVEAGITSLDQYVDSLGGMSRAIARARGGDVPPVWVVDQTQGAEGRVRSLCEQVERETRTRALNPRWSEGMLRHGYEGVRQVEAQVTTTMGWSATTGQVAPWVYQRLSETYVLDEAMRERLAALNPVAAAKVAGRLIEAADRRFWAPSPETLAALHAAADALEDRLEGIAA